MSLRPFLEAIDDRVLVSNGAMGMLRCARGVVTRFGALEAIG